MLGYLQLAHFINFIYLWMLWICKRRGETLPSLVGRICPGLQANVGITWDFLYLREFYRNFWDLVQKLRVVNFDLASSLLP